MAYVVDGNLYVQDSGGQPVQLTRSGKDSKPVFLDDGLKLVFLREERVEKIENRRSYHLYSINADGSQEQLLVNGDRLIKFGQTYDEFSEMDSFQVLPGSHKLLFNTRQLNQLSGGGFMKQNRDLFIANIDTAELSQIIPPETGGNFGVSPNGKLVWLLTEPRQINIIDLTGNMVRENFAIYASSGSDYSTWPWPIWARPDIFWSEDSKKLMVIPASDPLALSSQRTIYLYSVDGRSTQEIFFDPPLTDYHFIVSPDWNWIVYTSKYPSPDPAVESKFGMYVGNLRDGTNRRIDESGLLGLPDDYFNFWSPDGRYFVVSGENEQHRGRYIGTLQGDFFPVECGYFLGWVDAKHYLCAAFSMREVGKEDWEQVVQVSDGYSLNPEDFAFVVQKR